ncbi:MAG: VWA domain-containing protein [Bacteroidales bacterium]|nr:VWA domain-containing protein [Bacteroidales bacterium]
MLLEHPRILWLLLVVPLMIIVFIARQRRQRHQMEEFATNPMLHRLQPDVSRRRPIIKLALLCVGVAMLIVAWANPRMGSSVAEGEQSGIDMAVCIDVSNSMLAQDMKPNRMARSKQVVQNLMSQLGGDRISLVVFAGRAFIEMPLTNDYSATKMFLDQIGTDLISEQGTAIGDAIEKGMATLGYTENSDDGEPEWEPNKSRAIVIISDGENHEDDAIDAAKEAAKEGIMVCTIGIGSPQGSQIPIEDRSGKIIDWRKDSEGNVVTTHLNEEMLRDIAKAGNGIYAHAGNGNAAVEEVVKQLSTLESQKFGASQYTAYKSQYQYPLAVALLCLLLEVFIFERRNPRINIGKMIRRQK